MLSSEFVAMLACPRCRQPLQLDGDFLICRNCRVKYAVENDIPNLIMEEAIPLDGAPKQS